MSANANEISVAIKGDTVHVRIQGRANFASSIDFRRLIEGMRERGHHSFLLELSACLIMDSTFLGVLSRLALDASKSTPEREAKAFTLLNPSDRVAGLLDNLGVLELFEIREAERQTEVELETVEAGPAPSKAEASKNSIEAHETLIEVNPENEAKFKDVIKFLAEDLKNSGEN